MRKFLLGAAMLLLTLLAVGCGSSTHTGTGGNTGGGGTGGGGDNPDTPVTPVLPTSIGNKLYGVDLGPYLTGNPNNGDVVTEATLRSCVQLISVNFQSCRVFSTTAGLERFPAIAKEYGLRVAVGAWLSRDVSANEREITGLITLCQTGQVDVAIVGSETLLRNDLTDAQLIGYINRVRATGVTTTTADTWNALINHPAVLDACDEIWANFYPYWEGVAIENAFQQLQSDYDHLLTYTNGKRVVVSETGWPSAGDTNLLAVPSPSNQSSYFADFIAWARGRQLDYYIFEAFDEPWKVSEPGGVGQHWGLWDATMQLKSGCASGFLTNATNLTIPELDFPYTPIEDVPAEINDLGHLIGQQQRNVVTPGGSEWNPGFSSADQAQFEQSGRLAGIVSIVQASDAFTQAVPVLRGLSTETRDRVLAAYRRPIYPTWAMNGHIGSDGTTNAGYAVESEIANALADAVRDAL